MPLLPIQTQLQLLVFDLYLRQPEYLQYLQDDNHNHFHYKYPLCLRFHHLRRHFLDMNKHKYLLQLLLLHQQLIKQHFDSLKAMLGRR